MFLMAVRGRGGGCWLMFWHLCSVWTVEFISRLTSPSTCLPRPECKQGIMSAPIRPSSCCLGADCNLGLIIPRPWYIYLHHTVAPALGKVGISFCLSVAYFKLWDCVGHRTDGRATRPGLGVVLKYPEIGVRSWNLYIYPEIFVRFHNFF